MMKISGIQVPMYGQPSFEVGIEVSDKQVQSDTLPRSFSGNFTVKKLTDSDVEIFKSVIFHSRACTQERQYFFHETRRFSYIVLDVETMEFEAFEA